MHVANELVLSALEPVSAEPSSSTAAQLTLRLKLVGDAMATVAAVTITENVENRMIVSRSQGRKRMEGAARRIRKAACDWD
jgi:hypothetical protein